jgi:Domain of unknown function (DUF4260)
MQSQPPFSRPVYLLRAEALCALFASCGAYHLLFPHHWVMFACLFLVPDLSLLTYARGPNAVASIVYNVVHSYVLPALLGILAVLFTSTLLGEISLIWIGHIGLDRVLGYGLKYPTFGQFTHIQSAANPVTVPNDLNGSSQHLPQLQQRRASGFV